MKHEQGFTLIELLVVIAIITILPLVVVSDFPGIRLKFALSRAVHTFAQDVRNTQDLALSSFDFVDRFGVAQDISGYGIFVDLTSLGNAQYVIYADHYPGNGSYDQLDYIVKTVDFGTQEQGIIISQIGNVQGQQASINFVPPNPDISITELSGSNTSVDIVFSLESDPEVFKMVSINKSGLVEVR